jgi:YidC/Oxa1 family membrane protein insertase
MQKQYFLAIILCFLVIYGWQALFPPPEPPKPTRQPASPQQVTSAPSGAAAPPALGSTATPPAVEPAPATPLVAAPDEREVHVGNKMVEAVFTTRGATLKSWRLKNYKDGTGASLELVPSNVPGALRPFTLEVEDPALSATLREALFKPDQESVDASSGTISLQFEYRDAAGLAARKTFTFSPAQPYIITFSVDVSQNGQPLNPLVRWGPALGTGVVSGGMNYAPAPQPIFYRDGSVTRVQIKNIEQHRQQQGSFLFAGVDDHYFLSAVLPKAQPLEIQYEPVAVTTQGEDPPLQFVSWSARLPSAPENTDFFFGPKDLDVLKGINPDLVKAIDFGMFSWLVVPLLRSLKWLNGYIHNYGWSIIALTVLINLAILPLRHKSVVSMRKMQELQPQLKAIQERYAKLKVTDPGRQKMNEEVMALYRQHGTNPAAGCVPLLLTFPVLVAFYSMLSVAIELRGAPFVGWIKDLSTFDPWFVTPILMGVTMFVQQKMTPTVADPVQQKMMMFMPLMFTGMLMWAPSGLVLYWTVSNLWGIGQQSLTNRLIGPAPQHAVRPPAERQLKTAGSGKSPQAAKERK